MKYNLQAIWANKNYRTSVLLLCAILVWMTLGLLKSTADDSAEPATTKSTLTRVKAAYIEGQSYQNRVKVRARTEAKRRLSLKAWGGGVVSKLPVAEGEIVSEGDVICEQAVEDRALRVAEAKSTVAQTTLEYDGALKLKSGGYQSRTAIASAKARLDSAKANLKQSQLALEKTRIKAPFAGVLDRRSVEIGDLMERGDECGVLLDLNPLVISGRVSEQQVGAIRPGMSATAKLVTGEQVTGVVSFVAHESDNITRTFQVKVEVDNADAKLRGGITTELSVPVQHVTAHLVAPSLLALADDGKVGVRILSEEHEVQFMPVELIGDRHDGVWVTGLPERALLITVGQEYVSPGEKVTAVIEPSDATDQVPVLAEPLDADTDASDVAPVPDSAPLADVGAAQL